MNTSASEIIRRLFVTGACFVLLSCVEAIANAEKPLVEGANPSVESSDCRSCTERKQRFCARECELVPPANAIQCQQTCVAEYCAHHCTSSSPGEAGQQSCESCLDQQFNLCESVCSVGTDRAVALCKLDCSSARCKASCPKPSLPSTKPDKTE